MADEAALMRDADTAEHHVIPGAEGMHINAGTGAHIAERREDHHFGAREIAIVGDLDVAGFTDDAALAEWAGLKVSIFPGEAGNSKITDDSDFARAEMMVLATLGDVRTGTGIDVHAFGPGDHVMLGGIRIAHERSLICL